MSKDCISHAIFNAYDRKVQDVLVYVSERIAALEQAVEDKDPLIVNLPKEAFDARMDELKAIQFLLRAAR